MNFRRLLALLRLRPAKAPAVPRTDATSCVSSGCTLPPEFIHTICYGHLASAHLRIQVVVVFGPGDNRHSAYKIYLN